MGLFVVKVARKFKANSNPKVIEDNINIYIFIYIPLQVKMFNELF